jgi:hypothetical protein
VFACVFTKVETKWKNITKKYRDVVDHNSVSGNERKQCPFYEELSEVHFGIILKLLTLLPTHYKEVCGRGRRSGVASSCAAVTFFVMCLDFCRRF